MRFPKLLNAFFATFELQNYRFPYEAARPPEYCCEKKVKRYCTSSAMRAATFRNKNTGEAMLLRAELQRVSTCSPNMRCSTALYHRHFVT